MGYKLYLLQKSFPINRLIAAGALVIQNQVSVHESGAQSLSPLLRGHVRCGEHFSYEKASADKILYFLCLETGEIQCQGFLMIF